VGVQKPRHPMVSPGGTTPPQRLHTHHRKRFGKLQNIAINSAGGSRAARRGHERGRVGSHHDMSTQRDLLCAAGHHPLLRRTEPEQSSTFPRYQERTDFGLAHYSASNTAVIGFHQFRKGAGARGDYRQCQICPGVCAPAMWDCLLSSGRDGQETRGVMATQVCLCRTAPATTVEDIGPLVVYLALARSLTGRRFNVDAV